MTYVLRRVDGSGIYRYYSNSIRSAYSLAIAKKYSSLAYAKLDIWDKEGWEIVDFHVALEDSSLASGHRDRLDQTGNRFK